MKKYVVKKVGKRSMALESVPGFLAPTLIQQISVVYMNNVVLDLTSYVKEGDTWYVDICTEEIKDMKEAERNKMIETIYKLREEIAELKANQDKPKSTWYNQPRPGGEPNEKPKMILDPLAYLPQDAENDSNDKDNDKNQNESIDHESATPSISESGTAS